MGAVLLAAATALENRKASCQEWLAPIVPASAMPRPGAKEADHAQPTSRRRQAAGPQSSPVAFQSRPEPVLRIELGRPRTVILKPDAPIAVALGIGQTADNSPLLSFDSHVQMLTPLPAHSMSSATTRPAPPATARSSAPPTTSIATVSAASNALRSQPVKEHPTLAAEVPNPAGSVSKSAPSDTPRTVAISTPSVKAEFPAFQQSSIASALESFDSEKVLLTRHNVPSSRRNDDQELNSPTATMAGNAAGHEPRLPQERNTSERFPESPADLSVAPRAQAAHTPAKATVTNPPATTAQPLVHLATGPAANIASNIAPGVVPAEPPKRSRDATQLPESEIAPSAFFPSAMFSEAPPILILPAAKTVAQTVLDKPVAKSAENGLPAKASVTTAEPPRATPPAEVADFEKRITAGPQEMVTRAAASFTAGTATQVAHEPKLGVEVRLGTTPNSETPILTQVLPPSSSTTGASKIATSQRSRQPEETRPTAPAPAAEAPQRGLTVAPKIAFPVLLAADHRDVHEPRTAAPPAPAVMQPPATKAEKSAIRVERQEPTRAPSGPLFETLKEAGTLKLTLSRPMLLRMKAGVYRVVVADQNICDVVRITGRDLSITGRAAGQTHVTFFFEGSDISEVTYLVEVQAEAAK